LLKDTSTDSIEWHRFGFACYNLGKPDEVLLRFRKAEATNPPAAMQPYLYSRMANAYSLKNDHERTLEYLNKAVNAGYVNLKELDTAKEFVSLEKDVKFNEIRTKVHNILYPCYINPHAREFDFWVGEWDVYAEGTKNLVGHSLPFQITLRQLQSRKG